MKNYLVQEDYDFFGVLEAPSLLDAVNKVYSRHKGYEPTNKDMNRVLEQSRELGDDEHVYYSGNAWEVITDKSPLFCSCEEVQIPLKWV